MSRIRLLILITDLKVGGTPLDVLRLATALPHERFHVLVVSLADVGPIGERLRTAGVAVHACNARNAWDALALARLHRIIRAFRPDVVHSLLFHANVAARLVAPATGVDIDRILCSILTVERERRWHLAVEALTCRRCRFVVGNSPSVVEHLRRAGHVPPSRLRCIPGGIDVDAIAAASPLSRDSLAVPQGVPIVLWIGRMDPVKGLDELIEAAVLARQRSPMHVLFAGEGDYESHVRRLIARADAAQFIRLLGRRDDVAALLATADVFAFPSRSEGLPNALIEAMAAGKAIVTTDAPGCRDLVRHDHTGLIVPARKPRVLADAITRLLSDADLRRRLGKAAASWASAHCALSATIQAWMTLYEKAARRSRGSSRHLTPAAKPAQ